MSDQQRRSTDIDPAIENRIQEVVADTRHRLIQEITVLATAQATATLQATREHGEVRAEIQGLRRDLEVIPEMREDLETLKLRSAADDARTEAIDKLRIQQRWLLTFLVAAVPAAIVVAPHIH